MRRTNRRGGKYIIFTRTWYKPNSAYPDGLEPHAGNKNFLDYAATEDGAKRIAQEYNATHQPGKLSKMAEYKTNW